MALQKGAPALVHSDQGRQYAVRDHVDLLSDADVVISLSDAGAATQNAPVERFIGTLKDEHHPSSEYGSLADMRHQLKYFLEIVYNTERIHSALNYLTRANLKLGFTNHNCLTLPDKLYPEK
jgi:transposase InsO family protein